MAPPAVFLSPQSLSQLPPPFTSNRHPHQQNTITFFPKASLQSSDNGNIDQPKRNENDKPSDRKRPISPTQEEFLALFRRIEFSISKEKASKSTKSRTSTPSLSKGQSVSEAVLEALKPSKKDVKEGSSIEKKKKSKKQENGIPNSNITEKKETSSELEKLKLTELKEAAKAKGVRGYSKMKKQELIELLKSYSN